MFCSCLMVIPGFFSATHAPLARGVGVLMGPGARRILFAAHSLLTHALVAIPPVVCLPVVSLPVL